MKVLEINTANNLSTGNIMLGIAEEARKNEIQVYTASKYTKQALKLENKRNNTYHFLIGNRVENTAVRFFAWYTDLQDVGPIVGTYKLINTIKKISPDIIHLHDIVGWYIDIRLFFRFLKKYNKPVIWTMHCCWAFTGRCIYYDSVGCEQWKIGCKKCPQLNSYPYSKVFDRCSWNFNRKKQLFCDLDRLTVVSPSQWLADEVKQSFFKDKEILVINNGIDLNIFKPSNSDFREKYKLHDRKIVLFVASAWSKRKGLNDALVVGQKLSDTYKVVIVGLNEEQKKNIPHKILGLGLTKGVQELVDIYSTADVYVNPTYEDNYPTVNLEAQACGTPVITYNTGGAAESVDLRFGAVVEKGDIQSMIKSIEKVCTNKYLDREKLVAYSSRFSKEDRYKEYVKLYKTKYRGEL